MGVVGLDVGVERVDVPFAGQLAFGSASSQFAAAGIFRLPESGRGGGAAKVRPPVNVQDPELRDRSDFAKDPWGYGGQGSPGGRCGGWSCSIFSAAEVQEAGGASAGCARGSARIRLFGTNLSSSAARTGTLMPSASV